MIEFLNTWAKNLGLAIVIYLPFVKLANNPKFEKL